MDKKNVWRVAWGSVFLSVIMLICGSFLISAVSSAIFFDQHPEWVETQRQIQVIKGVRACINREGCAEAIGVCEMASVAGGFGGGECNSFRRTTGKTVKQACCEWFPELDVCRTCGAGCYKQKPIPDGREWAGDR